MASRQVLALATRLDAEAEYDWLRRLRTALPGEDIQSFRVLSEEQLATVEIAIVADPDPADLSRVPNLKWIHSLWAGVERLVSELERDIPVVRLVDPELGRVMAESVLAWVYYLFRHMPEYARFQLERNWRKLPYRHPDQVTVGLLGLGALGNAAASHLHGAGFKVAGWSRGPKNMPGVATFSGEAGLDTVLARSDYLVCLLPLTRETTGLLDATRLSRMPEGGSLINFARGPIVVTRDLVAMLDKGHLAHAVLDVFDTEPLPSDAPLWAHPSVTVLPHISAPTNMDTAARIVGENIRAYRRSGVLPPSVDLMRGY
jgi:glyoxylate/hydroxypyruvate reductase A